MKKFILAAVCAVSMLFTACGGDNQPEKPKSDDAKIKIGVIANLNASEIEYNDIMKKLEKSYRPSKANLSANYIYFDKMNDMILALESNQIDMFSTYKNVANYMINQSDNKEILPTEKTLSDSFCFAVRKGDTKLKNEFNKAIKSMIDDGTLANLTKIYIIDPEKDTLPPVIEIPKLDGADTIKIAVTGDLPPFDFINADGTPAGFSTAVSAEISKRINKNIELISVDSAARASILSSNGADVVFWVAVPKNSNLIPANIDIPPEIDITEPYYNDNIVHVDLKK